MADITANQIEKMIGSALNAPTQNLKKERFQNIINDINNISRQIQFSHNQLLQLNQVIKNYQAQGLSRNSALHFAYTETKFEIQKNKAQQLLQDMALEGYEIVNRIRQILTGEKITYKLGVGSKKRQKLIQAQVDYNELVPMVYLEARTQGYSLRIKLSQKALKNLSQQDFNEANKAINRIQTFVPGASTLYSAIYRYFTDTKLKQKGNWGNFYEVYQLLLTKNSKGNKYKPTTNTIRNAFKNVLSGGGTGGSFAAGGDVGTLQVKGSFGSNPTLTTVNTIINQLDNLIKNLQDFINTGNLQGLIKMLTREKTGIKIFDAARQQAIDSINDVLKNFG